MRIRKTSTPSALPLNTAQVVDSYTTSTTDAYSANYTNSLFEWKLLGSKTGTTSISLPSSFNELLCMVKIDNNANVQIPIIVPYICLLSSAQRFASGYYMAGSSVCAGARVEVTTTNAILNSSYLNTSDKQSTTVVDYYYR